MQKQIRLSTKISAKGKERLIDGKSINSIELEDYIRRVYNLTELSNFSDFLTGKTDLSVGWYIGKRFEGATIETSDCIKQNVSNFNLCMGDLR
jgi:hypothetical protein